MTKLTAKQIEDYCERVMSVYYRALQRGARRAKIKTVLTGVHH
jgi:hypothetical protein